MSEIKERLDKVRALIQESEFDSFISNHFNDHTYEEIVNKYKYQIQEDNETNLGGLIYSAFQVAKIAWLYEDWLKQK